jgi:hypothetical protein
MPFEYILQNNDETNEGFPEVVNTYRLTIVFKIIRTGHKRAAGRKPLTCSGSNALKSGRPRDACIVCSCLKNAFFGRKSRKTPRGLVLNGPMSTGHVVTGLYTSDII